MSHSLHHVFLQHYRMPSSIGLALDICVAIKSLDILDSEC